MSTRTPKQNRRSLDTELIRIQGILRLMDEIQIRLWKLKQDCGEDGYGRAIAYLKSRKEFTLRRFNNNQPLQ